MDDSCAVCAESLEWVAYGACGHREVCSTCVARLRFICDDRRCCICKAESDIVFVTKALGDYTRTISDFSAFPVNAVEGKNGLYWYHEDTGAFFDDSDHYKMVKAMCRLSCSVCDKGEEQGGNEGQHRRRGKFRNIEQLKGHLFHNHRLVMCNLCLEGRKIFICEQKLYTRAQLNQHIKTGDSEVDGTESERGGFMGHPMCEFCRKPFYGDNELYTHMSTEHYTCHICQRQNPGQFEYYKNYDDLEMHFRQMHFLCEDEACLAKKFVVFTSESEMKRHNALEHGGHMSRSKRNSALQIPTSFRYRRSSEEDHRRGRGRGRGRGRASHADSLANQLYTAIQASFDTANVDNTTHDLPSQPLPDQGDTSEIDDIVPPFESLGTTDAEISSRYREALGQSSRNAPLEESSFPPLPNAPNSSHQRNPRNESEEHTMAARLQRRNKGSAKVLNSGRAWGTANSASSTTSFSQARPTAHFGLVSSSSHGNSGGGNRGNANGLNSNQAWPATNSASSTTSSSQSRPTTNYGLVSSSSPASVPQTRPAIANGSQPSSYANLAKPRTVTGNGLASVNSSTSWSMGNTTRVSHSASAPNLVERGSLDSMSNFPPVNATLKNKLTTSSQPAPKVVEDVQTANKSLVERMRSALEFDEDKYTAFKDISAEYRHGVIDTGEYLFYVQQFGLSHLVLELARLCPDSQKQRELIETYNASVRSDNARESGSSNSNNRSKVSKNSNKGKGKVVGEADSSSKEALADSVISTVRKLQANYKPSDENVEVLSKDGYRASKGKSIASVSEEQLRPSSANRKQPDSNGQNDIQSAGAVSTQNPGGGGGGGGGGAGAGAGKQRKKTSKFHRVRLGDGYARQSESEQEEDTPNLQHDSSDGLPVRGVWRNGGGQRLVSLTQKDSVKG